MYNREAKASGSGEIGRRAGLRIPWSNLWRFKSSLPHYLTIGYWSVSAVGKQSLASKAGSALVYNARQCQDLCSKAYIEVDIVRTCRLLANRRVYIAKYMVRFHAGPLEIIGYYIL